MKRPNEKSDPPVPPEVYSIDKALRQSAQTQLAQNGTFSEGFRTRLAERLEAADAESQAERSESHNDRGLFQRPWWTFATAGAAAAVLAAVILAPEGVVRPHSPVGQLLMSSGRILPHVEELKRGALLRGQEAPTYAFLDNRAQLIVDRASEVVLAQPNQLILRSGRLWLQIVPQSGTFTVDVPGRGFVEVVGTSFLVDATDKELYVETYEGKVRFTPTGTESATLVNAGQRLHQDSEGVSVRTINPLESPLWATDALAEYRASSLVNYFPSAVETLEGREASP